MSVKAIRYLLANNGALTAVVAANKIMAGVIPQGTTLPAIAISHISTTRRHVVESDAATEFCTSRIQVTVQAGSYAQQQAVLALIRAALPRSRGTVSGVNINSVLSDIEGPDFRDDVAGIYMQSNDFIVTYSE